MAGYDPLGMLNPKGKKSKTIFDGMYGLSSKKEKERDSRRTFTITQQKELKSRQHNKCNLCGTELSDDNIDYDHIKPWEDSGKTTLDNGQAICLKCHRAKTRKDKLKKIDKKRVSKKSDNFPSILGKPPKKGFF